MHKLLPSLSTSVYIVTEAHYYTHIHTGTHKIDLFIPTESNSCIKDIIIA